MTNEILQNAVLSTNQLYLDPSTVTVVASSVSAIVIAVAATAVIVWRNAKKKVSTVLKIDPNAKKEVEDDIVIKNDNE